MNEIYKNSTQFVYLDIHGSVADTTPTAVCTNGVTHGLQVNGPEALDGGVQRWTATVDLRCTQNIGEIAVDWAFSIAGTPVTKRDYFDVVAPLLELGEIAGEFGTDEFTEDEFARVESKVRNYIEGYTRQVFAPTDETIKVVSESNSFILPKRLISVTSSNPSVAAYELTGDGWGYTITTPSLVEYYNQDYSVNGVIRSPFYDVKTDAVWASGRAKRSIEITGRWGWERVPRAVQEAALILMEDFLAPESAYRDKYLISLTSPDWRIQYDRNAFRGTGNVRVDQLLEPYVNKNQWVVV